MIKKSFYFLFVLLFAGTTGYLIYKDHQRRAGSEPPFYTLLDRKGELAAVPEWKYVQARAYTLLHAIKYNPGDARSSTALATLYIQEARITGNHLYYDQAALRQIQGVLKKDPANFEALMLQAIVLLSQHHFADGLTAATKAQNVNPYNAFIYGLMVDGHVEMGNYDAAVNDAEKMVSIRPDLSSYSRISYLREIFGDYEGAIQAMKMAIDAGVPGDEATAWCQVQLGHLYEWFGELKNAALQYQTALEERPGYPYALAGLGRMAVAAAEYKTALYYYQQAGSLLTDYSIEEELVDLYTAMGQTIKAQQLANSLIDQMCVAAAQGNSNENIGHYVDQELAYAYLKVHRTDKALEHAIQEYNRRPANIDVNNTLAWVYYKSNKINQALPFINTALRTNSKNPVLLCHAGLIYAKAGEKEKAKTLLRQALQNNPNIDAALKQESLQALHQLQTKGI